VIRLVHAEFLKLRTTQVWFWLLVAAIAISALTVIGPLASGNVHNGRDVAQMFGTAALAYVVLFVLGVLGVTTEFRYQTITPTVLQTPSRWAIVTAKMITYALVGIAYSIVCVLVQLAIALPWLSAKNVDYSLGKDGIPHAVAGVFVVLALFGIVGLGVGALLRNQIVAVSVGVIFLLVLENVVGAIPGVRHIYPYMPGSAARSIADVTARSDDIGGVHLLPVAGGVIVLLLWAFVPAIVGAAFSMNRDIT
jgi:ABC-type transport system involved in multi-copper enzyme maturation permease subunit